MSLPALDALPDDARLWLVAFTEPVESARLAPDMDAFMSRWRHKGHQYSGVWTLLEERILAVAEPTLAAAPSGCAIDGMLRSIRQMAAQLDLALEDPQAVLVRGTGGLEAIPRAELEARLSDGSLDAATPVLDLALLNLGQLREGRLERPLADTWIGRKYLRALSQQL